MTTAAETDRLRLTCLTIVRFLSKLSNDQSTDHIHAELEAGVVKASARQLKMLHRDLSEWARSQRPHEVEELELLLKESELESLDKAEQKRLKLIQKLVLRGEIRSADEYRLVEARVSELCQLDDRGEEIYVLNGLLERFQAVPGDD